MEPLELVKSFFEDLFNALRQFERFATEKTKEDFYKHPGLFRVIILGIFFIPAMETDYNYIGILRAVESKSFLIWGLLHCYFYFAIGNDLYVLLFRIFRKEKSEIGELFAPAFSMVFFATIAVLEVYFGPANVFFDFPVKTVLQHIGLFAVVGALLGPFKILDIEYHREKSKKP